MTRFLKMTHFLKVFNGIKSRFGTMLLTKHISKWPLGERFVLYKFIFGSFGYLNFKISWFLSKRD